MKRRDALAPRPVDEEIAQLREVVAELDDATIDDLAANRDGVPDASARDYLTSSREAFEDMAERLEAGRQSALTAKQRAWLESVADIVGVSLTPNNAIVPRGREVEPAPVLRDLPKKPPGRR